MPLVDAYGDDEATDVRLAMAQGTRCAATAAVSRGMSTSGTFLPACQSQPGSTRWGCCGTLGSRPLRTTGAFGRRLPSSWQTWQTW